MSTMSINATTERSGALRDRSAVPWLTVVPLAVVLAYADGFWLVSMRGAAGAIERTQEPFASWLRESTLTLPVFVLAVLGALTLAMHWFGPVLRRPRTVVAAALMVVAAGTLVGIAEMAASSAYDYHLQSNLHQTVGSMNHSGGPAGVPAQQQASLELQERAVGFGSAILLVTNLALVGWVVALRGGRLDVSTTRQEAARALPRPAPRDQRADDSAFHGEVAMSSRDRTPALPETATPGTGRALRSRVDDLRLFLVAGLFGSAAIHAAVVPEHLTEWLEAGVFFIVLTSAELAVAILLLIRPQPRVLLAAALVSVGPLAIWLYSRTLGIPFGPEAGTPEEVGLADLAACTLEIGTLLLALVLLRGREWLPRRPPASAHARELIVVAVIAVTAFGLAGSGLALFDVFGDSGGFGEHGHGEHSAIIFSGGSR